MPSNRETQRRSHVPVLTEQDWHRLVPLLKNIDINRQQAAYNRLVIGMTLVQAGKPFGYSKQDVYAIVKAVLRWWDKLTSLPDRPKPPRGWVAVEFFLPRARVDEVRRVVEALCPQPAAPAPTARQRRAAARPTSRTARAPLASTKRKAA
jgi:hypothetical protein